ncbi:MAG: hypothetical protein OXU61_12745, partial [Gammaproteobacteria bacterium]|nr:hypothetical protein [Gammaproteobacteria bacterium]
FSAASRKSKLTRVRLVVSSSYIATCQALEFEMGSTRLLLRSETRLLVSYVKKCLQGLLPMLSSA